MKDAGGSSGLQWSVAGAAVKHAGGSSGLQWSVVGAAVKHAGGCNGASAAPPVLPWKLLRLVQGRKTRFVLRSN